MGFLVYRGEIDQIHRQPHAERQREFKTLLAILVFLREIARIQRERQTLEAGPVEHAKIDDGRTLVKILRHRRRALEGHWACAQGLLGNADIAAHGKAIRNRTGIAEAHSPSGRAIRAYIHEAPIVVGADGALKIAVIHGDYRQAKNAPIGTQRDTAHVVSHVRDPLDLPGGQVNFAVEIGHGRRVVKHRGRAYFHGGIRIAHASGACAGRYAQKLKAGLGAAFARNILPGIGQLLIVGIRRDILREHSRCTRQSHATQHQQKCEKSFGH